MWVNSRHPNPPESSSPPADEGVALATIERRDGGELRIRLREYKGHPFIWIQAWAPWRDGQMWPRKGGCSVRVGELAEVVAALQRAEDEVYSPSHAQASLRSPDRATRSASGPRPSTPPWAPLPSVGPAEEFNEF